MLDVQSIVAMLATGKFPLVQAFRVVMWSHSTVMLSIDTDRTEVSTRIPGENTDLPIILGKRCWAFPVCSIHILVVKMCNH